MKNFHKRYDKELVSPFPNRDESKMEVVQRRNKWLLDFFSKVDMDFSLIGNPQKPAIIINHSYCLSAFVSNFDLHFTKIPQNGEIIQTYKINKFRKISHRDFMNYFNQCEHRPIYKIKYINTKLYLSGYNFLDKENYHGKYPVFSKENYKIYFNKENAEEIIKDFQEYPLKIT